MGESRSSTHRNVFVLFRYTVDVATTPPVTGHNISDVQNVPDIKRELHIRACLVLVFAANHRLVGHDDASNIPREGSRPTHPKRSSHVLSSRRNRLVPRETESNRDGRCRSKKTLRDRFGTLSRSNSLPRPFPTGERTHREQASVCPLVQAHTRRRWTRQYQR